jgi:SWI/SNF-related matrix-associated actin-dependent regulator of chromatin subfamily A-like protein 1
VIPWPAAPRYSRQRTVGWSPPGTAKRHVVFPEPDWRGTYLEQAEDRAHRIGQTQPVLVTYLLLDQSAWSTDSWMDIKAKAKQAVIDAVLGFPGEKNSIRQMIGRRE